MRRREEEFSLFRILSLLIVSSTSHSSHSRFISVSFFLPGNSKDIPACLSLPGDYGQSCCDKDTDYTSRNINAITGKRLPIHV